MDIRYLFILDYTDVKNGDNNNFQFNRKSKLVNFIGGIDLSVPFVGIIENDQEN